MADYIMFAETANVLCGIIIEIKSGGKSGKSSTQQINAAEKFINFIFQSAQNADLLKDIETKIEKVRISERQLERTSTQTKQGLKRDENGFIQYKTSRKTFLINKILELPSQ